MTASIEPTAQSHPARAGRRWLLLGTALPFLAIALYAVQLAQSRLWTPWYMPLLGTAGVILVIVALRRARGFMRWLALGLVLLVASMEWTYVLATRLPPYSGPATVGRPLAQFSTSRADGTPFTDQDLQGDRNHAMVFFRGRW
jgi:hypothetical protein